VASRGRSPDKLSPVGYLTAIVAAFVVGAALWYPLHLQLEPFLPSPLAVVQAFGDSVQDPELWSAIGATLRRVLIGWVGAVALGTALGVWMGRSKIVDALALPWVMIGLAIPAPVIIIFAILFFGLEESSTLLALVASVTPFVVNIVYQGVKAVDPSLNEMANAYHLSGTERLRQVILPQVAPSLMAGVRFGFAMTWKIVVIVEALSTSTGIGAQLELFFRLLRPAYVLAWTFSFTIIMVLLEVLVFQTVERRLFRWRKVTTF
jgi:ABC-type nitrate/sulfonate/bicarbonate transport system permease component